MIETHPIRDRASWLAMRRKDITASDIGAILGLDKSRSAARIYAQKAGLFETNEDSAMMRRGRWLEPAVLEALRERHPDWEFRKATVYLRDPELRLGATPDVVAIMPNGLVVNVQCKVVAKPVFEREWDDEPPVSYQLQTLAETMLMEVQGGMLAALVLDTYSAELYEFDVARHPAAEERIRAAAKDFWDAVTAGREPIPLFSVDNDLITSRFASVTEPAEKVLDLTGDNHLPALLQERADLDASMKEHEARVEEIEAEVKFKLKGYAIASVADGWKVTWKEQTRVSFVVPEKTFRVLRVSKPKSGNDAKPKKGKS